MHMLPTGHADVGLWAALAKHVQQIGPAAVRRALGWQLYNVPNIAGALGGRGMHLDSVLLAGKPEQAASCWVQQCNECHMRLTFARGAADERCQLTAAPIARRFRMGSGLNRFVADLFEAIAAGTAAATLPQVISACLKLPCR